MAFLPSKRGGGALNSVQLRAIPGGEIGEAGLELDFGGDPGSARRMLENQVDLKAPAAPVFGQHAVAKRLVVGNGYPFGFKTPIPPGIRRQSAHKGISRNGVRLGFRAGGGVVWHAPKLRQARGSSRG